MKPATNPAIASATALARAVLAAEHFRTTGLIPVWATAEHGKLRSA
jgi:hypothetical protein